MADQQLIQIINKIPRQPQKQYSTDEQLQHLLIAANRLGLYDAADAVKQILKNRADYNAKLVKVITKCGYVYYRSVK